MRIASSCFKYIFAFNQKNNVSAAISHCISSKSVPFLCRFGDIGQYRYKCWQLSLTCDGGLPNEGDVADKVLNQILATLENDSKSPKTFCNAYIEKFCRAGNISAAVQLLQSLHNKNIFLLNAYNFLLVAAAESNDIDLSSQISKDLLVSSRSLSSSCYTNFARAFTKTNDCSQLLRFVEEVLDIVFPDSIIVVNRIIFAFAENRQIEKALVIFDHIKGLKCKPDLITYNIVLDILGCVGRVNEMVREFVSMKEAGIVPDFISYNTLLNNLRKIGRLDLCLVYFREMGESSIKPDLLAYTALIDSFGRLGNIEESLRLFSDMKQQQIRPSNYVYQLLINNLKKIGKVDLATTLLEEMNSCLSDLAGPKNLKRKGR